MGWYVVVVGLSRAIDCFQCSCPSALFCIWGAWAQLKQQCAGELLSNDLGRMAALRGVMHWLDTRTNTQTNAQSRNEGTHTHTNTLHLDAIHCHGYMPLMPVLLFNCIWGTLSMCCNHNLEIRPSHSDELIKKQCCFKKHHCGAYHRAESLTPMDCRTTVEALRVSGRGTSQDPISEGWKK